MYSYNDHFCGQRPLPMPMTSAVGRITGSDYPRSRSAGRHRLELRIRVARQVTCLNHPNVGQRASPVLFCFVLNQLFITRYMQPGGLWQRLCRCPLRGNGELFYKETFSDLEPACAVIVRYPSAPAPHKPPYKRKRKDNIFK